MGVVGHELRTSQSQTLGGAGTHRFDHDVAGGDEAAHECDAFCPADVYRDGTFVPVQHPEHRGHEGTHEIATHGALDLADVGTQPGQEPHGRGPRDGVREVDDADPVERPGHGSVLRRARVTRGHPLVT